MHSFSSIKKKFQNNIEIWRAATLIDFSTHSTENYRSHMCWSILKYLLTCWSFHLEYSNHTSSSGRFLSLIIYILGYLLQKTLSMWVSILLPSPSQSGSPEERSCLLQLCPEQGQCYVLNKCLMTDWLIEEIWISQDRNDKVSTKVIAFKEIKRIGTFHIFCSNYNFRW